MLALTRWRKAIPDPRQRLLQLLKIDGAALVRIEEIEGVFPPPHFVQEGLKLAKVDLSTTHDDPTQQPLSVSIVLRKENVHGWERELKSPVVQSRL